jgi:hypothetical protein
VNLTALVGLAAGHPRTCSPATRCSSAAARA